MEIITALKINKEKRYRYNKYDRVSYEYNGINYFPINLEKELIELGIPYEIVDYEFEEIIDLPNIDIEL